MAALLLSLLPPLVLSAEPVVFVVRLLQVPALELAAQAKQEAKPPHEQRLAAELALLGEQAPLAAVAVAVAVAWIDRLVPAVVVAVGTSAPAVVAELAGRQVLVVLLNRLVLAGLLHILGPVASFGMPVPVALPVPLDIVALAGT